MTEIRPFQQPLRKIASPFLYLYDFAKTIKRKKLYTVSLQFQSDVPAEKLTRFMDETIRLIEKKGGKISLSRLEKNQAEQ